MFVVVVAAVIVVVAAAVVVDSICLASNVQTQASVTRINEVNARLKKGHSKRRDRHRPPRICDEPEVDTPNQK